MRANRLTIRLLVLLGFGGTVGLASSCSAGRAQKSQPSDDAPAADTVVVRDGDTPVQVMYGVRPAPFDPGRPVREKVQ